MLYWLPDYCSKTDCIFVQFLEPSVLYVDNLDAGVAFGRDGYSILLMLKYKTRSLNSVLIISRDLITGASDKTYGVLVRVNIYEQKVFTISEPISICHLLLRVRGMRWQILKSNAKTTYALHSAYKSRIFDDDE